MDKDTAPWWIKVTPERAQQYLKDTENGRYDLMPAEEMWKDLRPTLEARGYRLRPRYDANWKPSWLGTLIDPHWCEDSIKPDVSSCGIHVSSVFLTTENRCIIL